MQTTIKEKQEKIIRTMSGLTDWFDKYEYLNDLGKSLPALSDAEKSEKNMLPGCQSKVWLTAELNNGHVILKAESDSNIIQGMLALLLDVLNNQPPEDIVNADLFFITETGLSENLSPSRANGLSTIVKELKRHAQDFIG
jgi:cysteine desulfuration protein SufE